MHWVEQGPDDAHVPKQLHEELELAVRRGVDGLVVAVKVPQILVMLRRLGKQLRLFKGLDGLHGRLDVQSQFVIIHLRGASRSLDLVRIASKSKNKPPTAS